MALKSFMDNLSSVFTEVEFKVLREPGEGGFTGIEAEALDASHVSMVKGRLSAGVEMEVPDASFCINVKYMSEALNSAHSTHFLDISRYRGSTDIEIKIYEPEVEGSNETLFTMKTLAKDHDTLDIEDIGYDYYLEVDAMEIKNAFKTASNQKAESIQLSIYQREADPGDNQRVFCFQIKHTTPASEVTGRKIFHSHVRVSGDKLTTIIIVNGGGDADGAPAPMRSVDFTHMEQHFTKLYHGSFSAEYLTKFVKNMQRATVTLRLTNDKPLIMDYPLGGAHHNGLRYVMAPVNED